MSVVDGVTGETVSFGIWPLQQGVGSLCSYRWPSIPTGSISSDSTNQRLKILREKKFQSPPKQNLNLPGTGNYLHCIRYYM